MKIELTKEDTNFNPETASFGELYRFSESTKNRFLEFREHIPPSIVNKNIPEGNRYCYLGIIIDSGITYYIFSEASGYAPLAIIEEDFSNIYSLNIILLLPLTTIKKLLSLNKIDLSKVEANKKRVLDSFTSLAKVIYGEDNYTYSETELGVLTLYLRFPKIIITNRNSESKLLRDLLVRFKINIVDTPKFIGSLEGTRATYTRIEVDYGYRHSHLSSGITRNYTNFCLGESALVELISKLSTKFEETYFEAFLAQLPEHMSYESIEGTPHINLVGVLNYQSIPSVLLDVKAKEVALDLLNNPESSLDCTKLINSFEINEKFEAQIDFLPYNKVADYLCSIINSNSIEVTHPYSFLYNSFVEFRGFDSSRDRSLGEGVEWGDSTILMRTIPLEDIDHEVEKLSLRVKENSIDSSILAAATYNSLVNLIIEKYNNIKSKYDNEYKEFFCSNIIYGEIEWEA